VIVIKIGGHLLFREGSLRVDYIRGLLASLGDLASQRRVVAVVGGGVEARRYIGAGRRLGLSESHLDIIGIHVSRVNAALLHAAYHRVPPTIPESLEDASRLVGVYNPLFMGGLQPGQSTTTVAALVAEALGASLYIATNVDGIYTDDPRRNPEAKLLREVTVSALKGMFERASGAGGYSMLDTLTLNILERSRIPALVFNGDPPSNIVRAVVAGDIGTRIVYT